MIFAFKYRLVLNCLLSYLCLNNNIVSCFNYLYHVVLSLIFSFLFIVFRLSCFVFSSYFYYCVFSIIIIILILFIMFYFVFYLSFLPLLLDSKPFWVWNLDPIWTLFAGLCTAQMRPKRAATARAHRDLAQSRFQPTVPLAQQPAWLSLSRDVACWPFLLLFSFPAPRCPFRFFSCRADPRPDGLLLLPRQRPKAWWPPSPASAPQARASLAPSLQLACLACPDASLTCWPFLLFPLFSLLARHWPLSPAGSFCLPTWRFCPCHLYRFSLLPHALSHPLQKTSL